MVYRKLFHDLSLDTAMFDTQFFASWTAIITGAFFFASLFTLVGIMSDFMFNGVIHLSRQSVGLSALAFSGYLWVAAYHKHAQEKS